jgi:hypothetical protein
LKIRRRFHRATEYDRPGMSVLRQYATEAEANAVAADLELQNTVHGPRDQADVGWVNPPVPVDGWQQQVGEMDAWICEGRRWLGPRPACRRAGVVHRPK